MEKEKFFTIIPTFDTVILPDVEYQLGTNPFSEDEKSRIKEDGGFALLMPLKKPTEPKKITLDSFFGLGVLTEILEIKETKMGTRLHCQCREKVRLTDVKVEPYILTGSFEPRDEIADITEKGEQKLLESLKKTSIELTGHIQGGDIAVSYIQSCRGINEFGAMFGQFLDMTPEQKYALLETDSLKERGLFIQDALLRFKGTIDLQVDLNKRYNDTEGNFYKRAAIQKQIGLLQEELDHIDPESASEEDDYSKKIEKSHMPPEVRKEVERVLKRFMEVQPNDPDRVSMENYLDFVTSLKWTVDPAKEIDLEKARKVLDNDHYGLDKVKDRIIQQLAVMSLKKKQAGSILLLVGAPGTGKTSMGQSIAKALDRKYVRISLGGIRDEAEIRGHRRTYIGAMPGRIMDGIKRAGTMNPVVVLDEIDKLSRGFDGDPSSALLEVLDPEQNNNFTDHYMNVPYDLSNVFFICTANSWDTIPEPLLDRMEMIHLNGYTPIEKLQIGRRHLLPRSLAENGLTKKDLRITNGTMKKIISDYTMEAGVRGLKKQFDILCRHVAAEFVQNGRQMIVVKQDNLQQYLGRKKLQHDVVRKKNPAGVVTGLAWTQAGGEILFIETTAMPGSGRIIITGQLGDVMKESASISVSLVKSIFHNQNLDFSDKDLHIHVPEGAVPKDGPSAGVTLFTALVSLVKDMPVDPKLAMTGEISLRGQVLPIGGLPEKLMAAQRAGVKKVLIPKENVPDLEDVPEEVKKTLEIVPVATVREVIRTALGFDLPREAGMTFARSPEKTEKEPAPQPEA